jgi:hypothetical protein
MDPRKQECHGLYLYGAGYFSRDENTLAIASADVHFCQRCPRMASCEQEHARRVRSATPAEVEAFERSVAQAQHHGFSALLAKLFLGQKGRDPFARAAIENFNRGHSDRGRISGLIVHSDVDPRRR